LVEIERLGRETEGTLRTWGSVTGGSVTAGIVGSAGSVGASLTGSAGGVGGGVGVGVGVGVGMGVGVGRVGAGELVVRGAVGTAVAGSCVVVSAVVGAFGVPASRFLDTGALRGVRGAMCAVLILWVG
jgi:hypothetical protein